MKYSKWIIETDMLPDGSFTGSYSVYLNEDADEPTLIATVYSRKEN